MFDDYYLLMIKEKDKYVPFELYSTNNNSNRNIIHIKNSYNKLKDLEPKIVKPNFMKTSMEKLENKEISVLAVKISEGIERFFTNKDDLNRFYSNGDEKNIYEVIPNENNEVSIDFLV